MPRAAIYASALFLGSAFWGFVPPLVFLTTGREINLAGTTKNLNFSSGWIQAALMVFLSSSWFLLFRRRRATTASAKEFRMAAGFSILFLYFGHTLQQFQAELLMSRRPAIPFENAAWIYLAAGVFFLALLLKPPRRSGWILGSILVFFLVIVFFLVRSFPLENGFSDMLLTLQAAGRSFLHGRSPYAPQLIPGPYWQRCCYWPGLWLSFLPAVVLNVDPRFLGAIYMVAFALMVWRGTGTQNRLLESWFLALYLLNPWALLRHDVYLPAYLFSWGGFFLALRQGRELAAARWFGWGLSMHPFSWALLPVWLAWVAKRQSLRTAWRNLLQALLIAAVVILPFLAWDPQGFFQGAVLYWVGKRAVAISHFGLVSWLYPWPGLLTALSLAFIGAGTWAAWKGTGSLDSLFRWLTITLGLALLASYHIEHYYYFVPLMLLLFHEIVLLEGENSIDQRFGSIRRVTQDT